MNSGAPILYPAVFAHPIQSGRKAPFMSLCSGVANFGPQTGIGLWPVKNWAVQASGE